MQEPRSKVAEPKSLARTPAAPRKGKAPAGRPRPTQGERSEKTRKELLEAAIKVFRKRGYLGFTVVEAARVAGVTRGAPLHHFRTTDAYLLAALEYLFEYTLARTEETTSHLQNTDTLAALMADARATYFREDFITGLDVLFSASKQSETRAKVQEFADRLRRQAEDRWRDGLVARGVPAAAAENVVMLVHCLVRGAAIRAHIAPTKDERIERALQFGLQLVRAYLKRTGGKAKRPPPRRKRAAG